MSCGCFLPMRCGVDWSKPDAVNPRRRQVLEYCEGGDLRAALTRDEAGELAWNKRGRQIAMDIARGLHFLHSHDVMHSDLKTKNILLTRDQATAKIADVGLAQFMVRICSARGLRPDRLFPRLRSACVCATNKCCRVSDIVQLRLLGTPRLQG